MKASLENDQEITVVTSDIRSFFSSIDPQFLLAPEFLTAIGKPNLINDDPNAQLHKLFVKALTAWRSRVSALLDVPEANIGLPIGFAASGVIANAALIELDRFVIEQLNPIYYGRYVDDVTLVLRRSRELETPKDVITWIYNRSSLVSGGPILRLTSGCTHCRAAKPGEDGNLNEPGRGTCPEHRTLEYTRNYSLSTEGTSGKSAASRIHFAQDKTRFYFLAGESGKFVLDSLRKADQQRASEWRELPELPLNAGFIGREMVNIVDDDGSLSSSLRTTANARAQRADFALALRNVEAYARELDPASWQENRDEFFRAVCTFALTPESLFDFERYLPRILSVAIACNDSEALAQTVSAVTASYELISQRVVADPDITPAATVDINGFRVASDTASRYLRGWGARIYELILKTLVRDLREGVPDKTLTSLESDLKKLPSLNEVSPHHAETSFKLPDPSSLNDESALNLYQKLFTSDLAVTSVRTVLLPPDWGPPSPNKFSLQQTAIQLPQVLTDLHGPKRRYRLTCELLGNRDQAFPTGESLSKVIRSWPGIAFPTRPATLTEYYAASRILAFPNGKKKRKGWPRYSSEALSKGISALRGYGVREEEMPTFTASEGLLAISQTQSSAHHLVREKVRIALAMVRTSREQLSGAVHKVPDLSQTRYARMIALVNQVVREEEKVDYLVLPELSMPVRWFLHIAHKLQRSGISLITGVEYLRHSDDEQAVSNQAWASLAHRDWGFPSNVVYSQDKQRPARGEELNLLRENRLLLEAELEWKRVPIIDHNGFRFAVLICSELSNIDYRAQLRGRVDAIIVPEWNRDTNAFSSIVESTAFDVNCFVVQVNNREHGDTRIRAPYKESYERDLVKVSGGIRDHLIIGSINIGELRDFQTRHHHPSGKFKTLPDGFKISNARTWIRPPADSNGR